MEVWRRWTLDWRKKTSWDDHQDHRKRLNGLFASRQRNLNNDIVSDVRKERFERLIDECKEYDGLHDGMQYRRYYLTVDSNHIYKFLIREPEDEKEEWRGRDQLRVTVKELWI